jgi:hypothetical protein
MKAAAMSDALPDTLTEAVSEALPADPPRDTDQRSKRDRKLLRLMFWLCGGAFVLAVVLGIAYALVHQPYASLTGWERRAWHLKMTGVAVQLLALAVAVWRWPQLVAWAARRGLIPQRDRLAALAVRYKAAGLLLLFIAAEIGPGSLARLLH